MNSYFTQCLSFREEQITNGRWSCYKYEKRDNWMRIHICEDLYWCHSSVQKIMECQWAEETFRSWQYQLLSLWSQLMLRNKISHNAITEMTFPVLRNLVPWHFKVMKTHEITEDFSFMISYIHNTAGLYMHVCDIVFCSFSSSLPLSC